MASTRRKAKSLTTRPVRALLSAASLENGRRQSGRTAKKETAYKPTNHIKAEQTTPARRSPRNVAAVQDGVYNLKYHPMDKSLTPIRAAKALAKHKPRARPINKEETAGEDGSATNRLHSNSRNASDSESNASSFFAIVESPPASHYIPSPLVDHSIHPKTRRDGSSDSVTPSLCDDASRLFDFESYEAGFIMTSAAQSSMSQPDLDGYEADTESRVPSKMRSDHGRHKCTLDSDSEHGSIDGVVYDCIVARDRAVVSDNPWLQQPKTLWRHMTKLDRRLYNLQQGQPDLGDTLPMTWPAVVQQLISYGNFMTADEFERWGGMPAIRARYEILRLSVQGSSAYVPS